MKYLIKRIFNMNFKQMLKKIDDIHNKTKKSKIVIFFDMIICGIKYQAGYMDYWLFEMYNLNKEQRKTIMTRGKNNALIKKYNNKNYIHIFENKDEFLNTFKKYVKRDYFIVSDINMAEFKKFANKHKVFIAKPRSGSCGKGIEKIEVKANVEEIYNYLLDKNLTVLEEIIIQNDELNRINNASINTLRIISVNDNGDVSIVGAYLRIGNDNKFVDNFNSGGMAVPITIEDGTIVYKALDKENNLYEYHPISKEKIVGFTIPMWEEVKSLVKKLALVVPEVGVVGWDIALTDKGPDIVEGNDFPGHDIYQLPPHRTNGIGVLPRFEKYLK